MDTTQRHIEQMQAQLNQTEVNFEESDRPAGGDLPGKMTGAACVEHLTIGLQRIACPGLRQASPIHSTTGQRRLPPWSEDGGKRNAARTTGQGGCDGRMTVRPSMHSVTE